MLYGAIFAGVIYGYRYYSAELGRWISRDPLGEAGGFNIYSFGSNSSPNGFDVLGEIWLQEELLRYITQPFRDLGEEIERRLEDAFTKTKEILNQELTKLKSQNRPNVSKKWRLRKDLISNDLITAWVGGELTLSSDGCCIKVAGKPKAAFTLKSPRFLMVFQVVGGGSGSLGMSLKLCNDIDEPDWSLLNLSLTGKAGLRGSVPGAKKMPGFKAAFIEGGGYLGLNVDLLEGWESRSYKYGWYAQASLRVDVGFWDFDQVWGTSSGDFDFF